MRLLRFSSSCLFLIQASVAVAQMPPAGPPAVGVARVEKKPITQTNEFLGRIQGIERVDIVARVTAFLDEVAFRDGAEVKTGDVLYRLERGPFEATLAARQAVADQFRAQLTNAKIALARAEALLRTPAGTQANVDTATANSRALEAQVQGAEADTKNARINLDYTTITSPIDGKIGRTAVRIGNVVSPSSGTLVTIVGQDPMYVVFPVSVRTILDLRDRYRTQSEKDPEHTGQLVVRLRLPDGRMYGQTAHVDFIDNSVQSATDTILLRATIANPLIPVNSATPNSLRELTDGEFVNVVLEGAQPIVVLAIPRAAVLTDQESDFVYIVDKEGKAQRRNIKLGQSTPTVASVITGLQEGELVIAEGLQNVRPGQPVSASPMTPGPSLGPETAAPGTGTSGTATPVTKAPGTKAPSESAPSRAAPEKP
ncbi:efflux RND transporter periplasmic adaptor subunit [Beijerinckia indica]|uniref:Efflux transporter, RND family, MFP subunit n=1 Tax=Beijerinckia indica subsp. indica (strain ATCC 9039 / DSM 1715 / NCIMB 8712) TaxID=395963 RepID=B2IBM6_BEII9|nr:efflux RND transporter periplasmic adaptor subunit [Beijerinckia indica]ACB96652.1 efflux transporter, RND family, MFP subunit [Beijerinckia indica subsp. indica ATCC 9039]